MNPTPPRSNAELVLQSLAAPILPDGTGLPEGFSEARVRRLFASRPFMAESTQTEFVLQPPAAPILPDETGLPEGFSEARVRRLFASRPFMADPPQAEGATQIDAKSNEPATPCIKRNIIV